MPCELTEIVAARTNPTRVQARQGPSTEVGVKTWGPTHNQEVICIQYPLETGKKTPFSNGLSLGLSATLQGRPRAQEYLGSTQQTPWLFCFGLVFRSYWSLGFWICFCFKEKNRQKHKVE